MGRSSFVFVLGTIVNFVCLLFSKPVAKQSREVFRQLQDRLFRRDTIGDKTVLLK